MSTQKHTFNLPEKLTGKNASWIDDKGIEIPYNRTTKYERLAERNAHKVASGAIQLHLALRSFKDMFREVHTEMVDTFCSEKGVDLSKSKGNHTWYNFDRSIKVEANAQFNIQFDDMTISAAREKFNAFLAEAVKSDIEFVHELIASAFETTNGKLDPKQVMGLVRYKNKVKHPLYTEAVEFIEESIRRSFSKTYFSVSIREVDGSYTTVKLDFASV